MLNWKPAAHFENGEVSSIKANRFHICKNYVEGSTLYCLYDGDTIAKWNPDLEPLKEEAENRLLSDLTNP